MPAYNYAVANDPLVRNMATMPEQAGGNAYFQFTGGRPHQEVLNFLKRNANGGAQYEIH